MTGDVGQRFLATRYSTVRLHCPMFNRRINRQAHVTRDCFESLSQRNGERESAPGRPNTVGRSSRANPMHDVHRLLDHPFVRAIFFGGLDVDHRLRFQRGQLDIDAGQGLGDFIVQLALISCVLPPAPTGVGGSDAAIVPASVCDSSSNRP